MIEPKSVPDLLRAPMPQLPNGKQPIHLLACGVLTGVNNVIVYPLHRLRFAEVRVVIRNS